MSEQRPTRRDLLKPVQLLGFAFLAAIFGGVVTLISMGFFQQRGDYQAPRALTTALVVAGVSFIVTLVVIALLILAVDPAQVTKRIDRPVLLPPDAAPTPGAATARDGAAGQQGSRDTGGAAGAPGTHPGATRPESGDRTSGS